MNESTVSISLHGQRRLIIILITGWSTNRDCIFDQIRSKKGRENKSREKKREKERDLMGSGEPAPLAKFQRHKRVAGEDKGIANLLRSQRRLPFSFRRTKATLTTVFTPFSHPWIVGSSINFCSMELASRNYLYDRFSSLVFWSLIS